MTVLCGACSAENRDAAKFCKGCGRKIAQAWPQATPMAVGAGEATVLLGAGASAALAMPSPPTELGSLEPSPAPFRPRIGNGRWIAGLGLGVALVVVTAAWWGHRYRSQEIVPVVAEPAAEAPASPAPASSAASAAMPEPAAAAAVPAGPVSTMVELSDKADPAPPPHAAAPAEVQKPRKAVAKKQPPPAPAPVVEAVAPAPAPPAPEPVKVLTPQEACAGRNFIAKAQCLAEQCARTEVASHPQCEAVRRQQRIEEEKRNPSMAG